MARRRTGALDDTAAHRQANTSPNSSQLPPHAEQTGANIDANCLDCSLDGLWFHDRPRHFLEEEPAY